MALIANLPKGTNLVLEPFPRILRKVILSSKSDKLILTVSDTLNPEEYISSTIAKSLISIRLVGLKFNNCSTFSGDKTSGKVLGDFGAVINSKGEESTKLFFLRKRKNPLAEDKCL